jgi:phosphoribosylformylglycinamidine cyclo-ligase
MSGGDTSPKGSAPVPRSYAESGVDIDRGEAVPRILSGMASKAVSREIGGFAGGIPIDLSGYSEPRLLSTTDGVGSKILLARELSDYSTIGIDLVAMCVNDLAVCGCFPSLFLDYLACHRIDEEVVSEVLTGIANGCDAAECVLAGGETAELPDLYAPGDIDLAGFAVGIVEAGNQLPRPGSVTPGAELFGLPSVGVHSNGLTLARKVIPGNETALREELLKPTKIYVRELKALLAEGGVVAAAHITGGGLPGNLRRVLPEGLTLNLSWDWPVPPVFEAIRKFGPVDTEEMRRVFNMGIGVVLVVPPGDPARVEARSASEGIDLIRIGSVTEG